MPYYASFQIQDWLKPVKFLYQVFVPSFNIAVSGYQSLQHSLSNRLDRSDFPIHVLFNQHRGRHGCGCIQNQSLHFNDNRGWSICGD